MPGPGTLPLMKGRGLPPRDSGEPCKGLHTRQEPAGLLVWARDLALPLAQTLNEETRAAAR